MNKWHSDIKNPWGTGKGKAKRQEAEPPKGPEKTAAWPGLPGKKGPNRAAGTPRVKTGMKDDY